MVSGVLGLLLRLMVTGRPQGQEEGRWREPCTRCPLKRAQRWWERKGKEKKRVRCGARVAQQSSSAWLQTLAHKLTGDAKSPNSLRPERGEEQK